jgi:hypothetical protein
MLEGSRTFPDLLILLTTEGAGFPCFVEDAPPELVIDLVAGTWSVPRRSGRNILIGNADAPAFGLRNAVIGVYRRASIQELGQAYADAREVHVHVLGSPRTPKT